MTEYDSSCSQICTLQELKENFLHTNNQRFLERKWTNKSGRIISVPNTALKISLVVCIRASQKSGKLEVFDATDSIELDLAGHLSQVDFGHMYLIKEFEAFAGFCRKIPQQREHTTFSIVSDITSQNFECPLPWAEIYAPSEGKIDQKQNCTKCAILFIQTKISSLSLLQRLQNPFDPLKNIMSGKYQLIMITEKMALTLNRFLAPLNNNKTKSFKLTVKGVKIPLDIGISQEFDQNSETENGQNSTHKVDGFKILSKVGDNVEILGNVVMKIIPKVSDFLSSSNPSKFEEIFLDFHNLAAHYNLILAPGDLCLVSIPSNHVLPAGSGKIPSKSPGIIQIGLENPAWKISLSGPTSHISESQESSKNPWAEKSGYFLFDQSESDTWHSLQDLVNFARSCLVLPVSTLDEAFKTAASWQPPIGSPGSVWAWQQPIGKGHLSNFRGVVEDITRSGRDLEKFHENFSVWDEIMEPRTLSLRVRQGKFQAVVVSNDCKYIFPAGIVPGRIVEFHKILLKKIEEKEAQFEYLSCSSISLFHETTNLVKLSSKRGLEADEISPKAKRSKVEVLERSFQSIERVRISDLPKNPKDSNFGEVFRVKGHLAALIEFELSWKHPEGEDEENFMNYETLHKHSKSRGKRPICDICGNSEKFHWLEVNKGTFLIDDGTDQMICSAEGKILTQILKFPSKFTQVQWISSQKIPKLQKNERGINDLILEQNKKRIFLWMEKVRPIVKAEGYLKVKWEKSLLFVPLDLDSDSRISSVSPSGFTVEKRNGEIMDKKVEKSVEELAKNICWAHKLDFLIKLRTALKDDDKRPEEEGRRKLNEETFGLGGNIYVTLVEPRRKADVVSVEPLAILTEGYSLLKKIKQLT